MIRVIKRASTIKPSKLRPGDQIGVISPGSPVKKSDLQLGINILKSSGFRVRVAPHAYDRRGYLAGEDKERLADLHEMFLDPHIAAIFCARGGYGTPRLLDKIQYKLIRKNPKILVGYSDVTALLIAINAKTGLVTFHGPMVQELARNNKRNWNALFSLLSATQPLKIGLKARSALIPGRATGPLVGGNLSLICHLVGTPFLPSLDSCILFVEEKGEPLYRIDRMMTQLSLSGQLRGLSGLIGGQFEGCGNLSAINRLLIEMVSNLNIPLATGLPVGHGSKNVALPIGLTAELDTKLMTFSVTETCVV